MTAHATHTMHTHSLASYRKAIAELGARAAAVRAWIEEHGPATDREVMSGMGFTDPNKVRPRISEMIKLGVLTEYNVPAMENGRHVRVVWCAIPQHERQQEQLFHAH